MTKTIFLKRLSATVQFILGFVLGISSIAGISGAAIFAYYKKMSVSPQKPVYPESTLDSANSEPEKFTAIEPIESTTMGDEVEESLITETETEPSLEEDKPEPEPAPEPAPEPEAEIPADAYRAVVTWPEGLSLRAEPSVNAGRVGGIAGDASIIILGTSADGNWQRVRLPWSNQEGWVKAGNTKRTSY